MVESSIVVGLDLNLLVSFLIAYGRTFRTKDTIKHESKTSDNTTCLKKNIDKRKQD